MIMERVAGAYQVCGPATKVGLCSDRTVSPTAYQHRRSHSCILEGAARPLYRPIGRWIADLWLVRELEGRVARLPAYVALGTLAVPFTIAEPLKVVAVYWIALGHFAVGAGTLVLAYGASFIVVERIYHAARPQLLTIVWFAAVLGYAAGLRDGALVKVRLARSWLRERRVWPVRG
jgi:hypothetical protein